MATGLDPRLLDAVYDIAVGERRWDHILRLTAESFGCAVSSMICEDSESRIASLVSVGTDDTANAEYIAHYRLLDFVSPVVRQMERGRVFVFRDLVRGPKYRRHPYAQEWLKRWDSEHILGVRLRVYGGWEVGIGVMRGAGKTGFSPAEVSAFAELAPHFGRVLRLHAALGTLPDPAAAAFGNALLILVDGDLTLRAMTPAAEDGIRRGTLPLAAAGRKVRAVSAYDQKQLERVVALSAAGNGVGPTGASFTTRVGNLPFRIAATPLAAQGADRLGIGARAAVALLIAAESHDTPHAGLLSRTGARALTATQATILELLTGGLTAKEIADQRGISPETVRQHIKAIRSKLGARNQKHLIAIAMTERQAAPPL